MVWQPFHGVGSRQGRRRRSRVVALSLTAQGGAALPWVGQHCLTFPKGPGVRRVPLFVAWAGHPVFVSDHLRGNDLEMFANGSCGVNARVADI